MSTSRKVLVGVIALAVVGSAVAVFLTQRGDGGAEVRMEEVERRDLVATVTASGNIRARREVDISSDVSARVASLAVEEGEDVEAGQVLVRLDPTQYEAVRSRAEAALSQAQAQAAQIRANLVQARRNFDRIRALYDRDTLLVSPQQLDDAETSLEVARANLDAAEFGVRQARASLDEAEDDLEETVIRAPRAGKVTRLNVEEGETVIIGTMNNPGSLILTISDLSVVELVLQVDETDVPELAVGDSASVEIDAFPDREFAGRVTEIGNSAIQPPANQQSGQQAAIDFEVVVTLEDPGVSLRPDLSATAEIVTDTRDDALAIPIIALTVRDRDEVRDGGGDGGPDGQAGGPGRDAPRDVEGVLRVSEGTASFVPVEVGIAGQEYFQVLSGLQEGDTVVSGPYQVIRTLGDGDPVQESPGPDAPGEGS
jgi:HlyD family secretion protein